MMKYIYILYYFDINLKYEDIVSVFKYRDIYYSEDEIKRDIREQLELLYEKFIDLEEYKDYIYDEFYSKFKPEIIVKVRSLKYLEEPTSLDDNLFDLLMRKIDHCTFKYDHNLNITEVKCLDYENGKSFTYKSLFPDKYHANKYETGDRVRYKYDENIYTIWKRKTQDTESIYTSNNPLEYREGYQLLDDNGMTYDMVGDFCTYLAVDEDLESAPLETKVLTENQIQEFMYNTNIDTDFGIYINRVSDFSREYNKFKRDDGDFEVYYRDDQNDTYRISNVSSLSVYNNDKMLLYMISGWINIGINDDFYIKSLEIFHKDKRINTIPVLYYISEDCKINIILERSLYGK